MSPTHAAETEQRLFDVGDAVKYLQAIGAAAASKNFVRTLISSGQITHLKIGKKFYVGKQALDRWIETREKRSR